MPPRRSERLRLRQQRQQPPQQASPIFILPPDLWVAIAAALDIADLAAYRATCQESLRAVTTHTTAALRKHYRAMVVSKLYLGSARVYSHYCATVRDIQGRSLATGSKMFCEGYYRITGTAPESPLRKWGHDFLKSACSYMDYLEELMQAVGWHGSYRPLIISFALWLLALFNQTPPALLVDDPWGKRYRVGRTCFIGTMREVCTEGTHLWFKCSSFAFTPVGMWALSHVRRDDVQREHIYVFFRGNTNAFEILPLAAGVALLHRIPAGPERDTPDLEGLYYCQYGIAGRMCARRAKFTKFPTVRGALNESRRSQGAARARARERETERERESLKMSERERQRETERQSERALSTPSSRNRRRTPRCRCVSAP